MVPNDRVRAFALWEGWFGYDRKKYAAMLREAFEPFVLCIPKIAEENLLQDSLSEEELKRFPLFAASGASSPLEDLISFVGHPPHQSPQIYKTATLVCKFPPELFFLLHALPARKTAPRPPASSVKGLRCAPVNAKPTRP